MPAAVPVLLGAREGGRRIAGISLQIKRKPINHGGYVMTMPTYTLNELIEKMTPQARRDKALIGRCADGLGLYAAQIAAGNNNSYKVDELRELVDKIVAYWGFDRDENATTRKDLPEAFSSRVREAMTGGAAIGDVYQSSYNVIFGLYRYGEDMAAGLGNDAMGDILDVSDTMKEIAAAWEFESDVIDDLTARLEAEVRDMLDGTPLPGRPVTGVVNVGYAITQAAMFENDLGFVLAHDPDAPSPFVTWRFGTDDEGGKWDEWGHYFSSGDRARIDYLRRVSDYVETNKVAEKPFPTTDAEMREPVPGTPADEKPSVMARIMSARNDPKPSEPGPGRDKKKQTPEH
jgi:hypothetical protein